MAKTTLKLVKPPQDWFESGGFSFWVEEARRYKSKPACRAEHEPYSLLHIVRAYRKNGIDGLRALILRHDKIECESTLKKEATS